jgi:hypothetical protein
MAAILTSTGIIFSDSTTQINAGVPVGGGTMSGTPNLINLTSNNGQTVIKQWSYSWTHPTTSGSYVDLVYNTGSYSDIHFILFLHSRTGANGFYIWEGIFGGYGGQYSQRAQTGNSGFNLAFTNISAGFGKISIVNNYSITSNQGMEATALFTNTEGVAAYNGTIYS